MIVERSASSRATMSGLVVALVGPFLTYLLLQALFGTSQTPFRTSLGLALHWLNFGALILIVDRAERLPASSIGIRPLDWWTVAFGVIAGILITIATGVLVQLLRLSADTTYVGHLQALPFFVRLLLVITAGVFEETLYRGYAFERLAAIWRSRWLAAAITLAFFTAMHAPAMGWGNLLPVGIEGALITLLYLWRRNLVLNILAHSTVDGIGLLIVPLLAR